MKDWENLTRKLEFYLRLRTFPVGFKLLEDKTELDNNKWVRRLPHRATLCQLVTIVRTFDWTVGATAEELLPPQCTSMIGLSEVPEFVKDGTMRSVIWVKDKEQGKKCEAAIPRIDPGKYEAVLLAPIVYNPFDPDIIILYANPAQMCILINAIQFDRYERLEFFSSGETSCSDVIAQCYLTGKPSLSIPCYGERRFGHAQDDELAIGIPAGDYERIVQNLEILYKRGIRYPISMMGATVNAEPALKMAYNLPEMK